MNIQEHIAEQSVIVTDDGEIHSPADVSDINTALPASNESRIARMHPKRDYDAEIKAFEADTVSVERPPAIPLARELGARTGITLPDTDGEERERDWRERQFKD